MKACVLISVGVLVICFTAIAGAPVKEAPESTEQIKNTLPEQEENELDNLAEDEDNIERLQNLAVHESQSIQYTNDNGNKNMVSETEKQVMKEPENHLISDVKQTLKQKQSSEEQKPHISTKTEIDLPDNNIHETIESSENDIIEEPFLNETPTLQEEEEVARYLLESHEFPQFDDALDDLVQSAIISPEEAIAYKDNVLRAYNDLEDKQELEDALYQDSPMDDAENDLSLPFEQLLQEYEDAAYPDELPEYDGLQDMDLQQALGDEMEMNDIVPGLLAEWIASATSAGDSNSEEILNILLNYITRGRDREEVEEAKNILAQLFSEVLAGRELEEEQAANQVATHNAMPLSNAIPENTSQESSEDDDTNTDNETSLESLPKEEWIAPKMTQTKHSASKRSSKQTGDRSALAM